MKLNCIATNVRKTTLSIFEIGNVICKFCNYFPGKVERVVCVTGSPLSSARRPDTRREWSIQYLHFVQFSQCSFIHQFSQQFSVLLSIFDRCECWVIKGISHCLLLIACLFVVFESV